MAADPLLALSGVSRSFGALEALRPVDLAVERGDFCAILGPSGCGKSTLLRIVAGFLAPTAGRVLIEGADVTRLPPERRPTNMVFQGHGLFPHLTVAQNVAFGLALRRLPRAEIAARVEEALRLVRLEGLGDRPVPALSGGQSQRVALARALVMRPKVLLLDEPLSALDLKLRGQMQEELRRIHREASGTFLFVTHDQGEAFGLANRVVVMNGGRVEQVGSPEEVYRRPASLFVAGFVGEVSTLRGVRARGRVALAAGGGFDAPGPDGPVAVAVRPEAVRSDPAGLPGRVEDVTYLGPLLRVAFRLPSGERLLMTPPAAGPAPRTGDTLRVGWDPGGAVVLPEEAP